MPPSTTLRAVAAPMTFLLALGLAPSAHAQEAGGALELTAEPASPSYDSAPRERAAPRDVKAEVPIVGYTYSAFGASEWTGGAEAFGGVAGHLEGTTTTEPSGGGRLWGSPIDRLTIFAEVNRRVKREAAPTLRLTGRIAGDRARGWALGASLGYKAEGFAELEGEVEAGALFSIDRRRWHADLNAVVGAGFEEEEADGEVALRAGYDLTSWMRFGVDGRGRYRLRGDKPLAGGRSGDFGVGPEVMVGLGHFFLAATGGPSTIAVADGIGWSTSLTLGGVLY